MRFISLITAVVLGAGAVARADINQPADLIEITYTKYVLDNGLTLIVHEDHKAPIVAVNVWYHVGSKNEKPGKTGFAHLFEHLMFNGSEHFDDDYFKAMEKVGATDLNGTTSEDRTNYFENAPKDALDYLLWMESDRMGHLLGVVTQAKLDEQRGVVQNEKRQGDNQPYAIARDLITKNIWPAGHPYSWSVIGSMEDLNAASLEDVKEWFRSYYGTANATLVVAGDVKPEEALAKVKRYFGDIPSGPPVARHTAWVAKRTGTHRVVAQDRVPQARLYKVWNIPQCGAPDVNLLGLAGDVLASGRSSRLVKRLVMDEQIATSVNAGPTTSEIAGEFRITATVKPGGDLAQVEKAIDEELNRFLSAGPTAEELQRAKVQYEAGFIRGVERIGGFGGKSDILAENQVFLGDPGYYKVLLRQVRQATPKAVVECSRQWLSDGQFILEVRPFPVYTTNRTEVARGQAPVPALKPEALFPAIQHATLSNGLKILFAERATIPVVEMDLLLNAGYATDQLTSPGTAQLALNMLDEGTQRRNTIQISDELDAIGANLGAGCGLDAAHVSINTLKEHLDKALDIYADIILNPSFPETEFARVQKQTLAGIKRAKTEPNAMAGRVFPELVYGKGHPYAAPSGGAGTEPSVAKLTVADLKNFHRTWFKPNNATLVVVGNTTLAELTPKLERLFQDWKAGETPALNPPAVALPTQSTIYLMDRPGSQQSVIMAGHLMPPRANPDEIALETLNFILGGTFTSRINMNLREDKHWTYGARTGISSAKGARVLTVSASVQGDKTKESMIEIDKELRGIADARPATPEELHKAVTDKTLRLTGRWETMGSVSSSIAEMVKFGLPEDYFQTYADKILALTRDDLVRIGKAQVHPGNLIWVVVGDRSKIEAGMRELTLGELKYIDPEGNVSAK